MHEFLTSPSVSFSNKMNDNVNHDLIVSKGDVLSKSESSKYIVISKLGSGTFGQVFRCQKNGKEYAIKVIKNERAYFNHGYSEIRILRRLKSQSSIMHLFSKYIEDFICKHHICIVMELLGKNLYEVLKMGGFIGLEHSVLKRVVKQIVCAMDILNRMGIIHCDLKPENILVSDPDNVRIKIVDFGNALDNQKGDNFYVQSRYYRAPEVIFGFSYDFSIDVWSLGCIIYELFLGTPLFPGKDNNDMINRMVYLLGDPPHFMIDYGCNSNKYFVKEKNYTEIRGNDDPFNINRNNYRSQLFIEDECSNKNVYYKDSEENNENFRTGKRRNKGPNNINENTPDNLLYEENNTNIENNIVTEKIVYSLREKIYVEDFIDASCFQTRIFSRSNEYEENEKLLSLFDFILKINHLERPLASQIKDHPYLIEKSNREILLQIKNEICTARERNQPNPAPKMYLSRRYSINESSNLDKTEDQYIRKRKKSLYDIDFAKNNFSLDENKHNR